MNQSDGTPSVHVVILNWNGGHTVCETIDAVLSADYPHTSVIVVDNASTDGSDVEIEDRFSEVRLIRNDANLGFAAGNNRGITHALQNGAAYILLLNNDALLGQAAIQTMTSALAADPGRGMIVPKIRYYCPGSEPRLWSAGAEWRRFPPRVTMRGLGEQDVGQHDHASTIEYATACALLIRREAFQQAGLFDESYFMYQEDYAFCDRVRSSGFEIWYEPRALVYHHVSASTGEGSPAKWHHWAKGISLFYIQHYGGRARAMAPLTAFLLWVMMRELAKGHLGWFKPFWRGVRAGWAEL